MPAAEVTATTVRGFTLGFDTNGDVNDLIAVLDYTATIGGNANCSLASTVSVWDELSATQKTAINTLKNKVLQLHG